MTKVELTWHHRFNGWDVTLSPPNETAKETIAESLPDTTFHLHDDGGWADPDSDMPWDEIEVICRKALGEEFHIGFKVGSDS